jgi:hypothetical protein
MVLLGYEYAALWLALVLLTMTMLKSSGQLWRLKLAAEIAGKVESVCIVTVSPIRLGNEVHSYAGAGRRKLKVTGLSMSDHINVSCSTVQTRPQSRQLIY